MLQTASLNDFDNSVLVSVTILEEGSSFYDVTTLTPASYYIYQEFLNKKRDPHETNDLLLTHLTPLTVYSLNSEKKYTQTKKKTKLYAMSLNAWFP